MITETKNKDESDFKIEKRGFNRITEGIFKKSQEEELKLFLKKTSLPFYNMRDKGKSMGPFRYKITANEVLLHSNDYDRFSVYESLAIADEKLVLQGEIHINTDFEVCATLSDIKKIPNRVAMQNPIYRIDVDLKERREPYIKGLTQIIDYVIQHELFGVVVEFSLFDTPVGINKENILIWELRNY